MLICITNKITEILFYFILNRMGKKQLKIMPQFLIVLKITLPIISMFLTRRYKMKLKIRAYINHHGSNKYFLHFDKATIFCNKMKFISKFKSKDKSIMLVRELSGHMVEQRNTYTLKDEKESEKINKKAEKVSCVDIKSCIKDNYKAGLNRRKLTVQNF